MATPTTERIDAPHVNAARGVSWATAVGLGLRDWDFRRRGSRSEYWWLALSTAAVDLLMSAFASSHVVNALTVTVVNVALAVVLFKAVVRRYHDIGRSWWWALVQAVVGFVATVSVLLGFVAAIANALDSGRSLRAATFVHVAYVGMALGALNTLWALFWLCRPGTPAQNRWG